MQSYLRFIPLLAVSAFATACGGDDPGNFEPRENSNANDPTTPTVVEQSSGLRIELDRAVYADGEELRAVVDFASIPVPADPGAVAFSSEASGDAEPAVLENVAGEWVARGVTVRIGDGAVTPNDGVLTVPAAGSFYALYFVDREKISESLAEEDMVFDAAVAAGESMDLPTAVEPTLAVTSDELSPPPGGKRAATLLVDDGLPVQVATRELIVAVASDAERDALLERTGGAVLSGPEEEDGVTYYLISFDPERFNGEGVSGLRALFGESGALSVSNEEGLDVYAATLALQLDGYRVAVNPRIQWADAPTASEIEDGKVTFTMEMKPANSTSGPCIPGDPSRPCVNNVPAMWSFLQLAGADLREIDVAFLDMGFSRNADFRSPSSGTPVECDMGTNPVTCGPGAAEGAPTVNNSFFGGRSYHGTGVVTTAGGVANNGFGAAGTGGQVVVPMLYEYSLLAYAFEIGSGIRRAVNDGAACVNISGGYPCNILTNIGPDFNICTGAGRAGICSIITAGAGGAAAVACAALGPFFGGIPCAIAAGAAATASAACFSSLALGDIMGPMASAVRYAKNRGVPVVASAGNALDRDTLPAVIRDLVELEDFRLERWQVVPAAFPDAIAVGAVNSSYQNVHFFGDRVDIWAPITSAYTSPSDPANPSSADADFEIGGTSAAAPFITGVIAAMQAVNPSLNPNNPALSDAQRRRIVDDIVAALTSPSATFDDSELVAKGFASDPRRRLVVDPLGAVQAVSDLDEDLASSGLDLSLGFNEALGSDDGSADARALSYDVPRVGTVMDVITSGGGITQLDEDWYSVQMPSGSRPYVVQVALSSLGATVPTLDDASFRLISRGGAPETTEVFETLAAPDEVLLFPIVGGDASYEVLASTPQIAEPTVALASPIAGITLCAGESVAFDSSVQFPAYPSAVVSGSDLEWLVDGVVVATGATANLTLSEGTRTVAIRAYGEPSLTAQNSYSVVDCVGSPPTVMITSPSGSGSLFDVSYFAEGTDANGDYYEVTLVASVSDPDGPIPSEDIVWTTDSASATIQPGGNALLGTGTSITVRLYSSCVGGYFGIVDHEVVVTVSDGESEASDTIVIRIETLC